MDDKFMVINEVGIGIYGGETAYEAEDKIPKEKEEEK